MSPSGIVTLAQDQINALSGASGLKVGFVFTVLGKDQGDQIGRILSHGRLFALGSGLKLAGVAHIYGMLFTTATSYILMLTKNCLGYILGDFFPTHIITL
jgi:hypothetical protein